MLPSTWENLLNFLNTDTYLEEHELNKNSNEYKEVE